MQAYQSAQAGNSLNIQQLNPKQIHKQLKQFYMQQKKGMKSKKN